MGLSMKTIGIIGLGLIGGSIAKALKSGNKEYQIFAWDKNKEALDLAISEGVIDIGVTDLNNLSKCDIIFLCVPVEDMKNILNKIKDCTSDECIFTDVGSTKSDLMTIVKKMGLKQTFIGGHPLAGSEKSGYSNSKANLFENAFYCLTPFENTNIDAIDRLRTLVEKLGAIPLIISPEEHDRATAAISHVPHIIASSLVNLVKTLDGPDNIMKTIAAGGFKDITRIASSSPELWTGICLTNMDKVIETLEAFENLIENFKYNLIHGRDEEIKTFFRTAGEIRNSLSDNKSLIQKTYDIIVDVQDRPGIIATIASALAKENINIKNIGILNSREAEEGALKIQFEDEASRNRGLETLKHYGYKAKSRD